MTEETNKPNIQKLLNMLIYKRQQEANDNPDSPWITFYDVLIRNRLNEQAMEGVYFCYYLNSKIPGSEVSSDMLDSMLLDNDNLRAFQKAHSGDYL